jgi:hypothetical protein
MADSSVAPQTLRSSVCLTQGVRSRDSGGGGLWRVLDRGPPRAIVELLFDEALDAVEDIFL